jgi:hypothetical protein
MSLQGVEPVEDPLLGTNITAERSCSNMMDGFLVTSQVTRPGKVRSAGFASGWIHQGAFVARRGVGLILKLRRCHRPLVMLVLAAFRLVVGPISLRLLLPNIGKAVAEIGDIRQVHSHRVTITEGCECGHGVLLSRHHVWVARGGVSLMLLARVRNLSKT